MTAVSFTRCQSVNKFNDFMKEAKPIEVKESQGRKFQVGKKQYTMNEIVHQFEKCIKKDSKANVDNTKEIFKRLYLHSKIKSSLTQK